MGLSKIYRLALLLGIALSACHHHHGSDAPTIAAAHPQAVTLPAYFPAFPTDNGSPLTIEGIKLGKALFFDKTLSADGTVACASCHNPATAFADTHQFSIGVGGQHGTRQGMSLANLAFESHLFWDGRRTDVATLVQDPITRHDEMGMSRQSFATALQNSESYRNLFFAAFLGAAPTFELAQDALSQFVRSQLSVNSKYDGYLAGTYSPTPDEVQGMHLFFTHPDYRSRTRGGNCGDCHQNITLSGRQDGYFGFRNNGLPMDPTLNDVGLQNITNKPTDKAKFRVPTLRNIALTPPYMHDGRFKTLQQVLDHYNSNDLFTHPGVDTLILNGRNSISQYSLGLTETEKTQIIAFLHMLTDTSFAKQR